LQKDFLLSSETNPEPEFGLIRSEERKLCLWWLEPRCWRRRFLLWKKLKAVWKTHWQTCQS